MSTKPIIATLLLRGSVPGKKNAYRRSANKRMYRPAEIVAQIDALILQARSQWPYAPRESAEIRATFYVNKESSDLDNAYTCIQDVLVKAGVIRNDSIKHVKSFSATAEIVTGDESVCVEVINA